MKKRHKAKFHASELKNTEQAPNRKSVKFHGPAFWGLETTSHLTNYSQIEARARELLTQLSLDEKMAMMSGNTPFWPGLSEVFGGGYGNHPWVAGAMPQLGIPGIRFVDGPRGEMLAGATTSRSPWRAALPSNPN